MKALFPQSESARSWRSAASHERVVLVMALGLLACNAPAIEGEPPRPLRPDSLENNGWDRDSDLLHVDVSLSIDLEENSIQGQVSNQVRALIQPVEELKFHSLGLEIESVRDATGRELEWRLDEPVLTAVLAESLQPGEEQTLTIRYGGRPEAGLYFVDSSKDAEGEAPQAWTQGQPEDNRRWIPTWDFPNDRATYSGHFRVEAGYEALSNGRLTGVEEHQNGERTFHWELERTIPTYLIALAVGRWEHYADQWNGMSVDYWVGPGTGEVKARQAFGETPEMLAYFSELLGVEYPYSKYGQVAVAEFVAGGMENASLTIQNDYIIGTEREHLENDGETRLLVAHELAHQWFGDLVTCFGWSHLWLNEAWASYLELMFQQHKAGVEDFTLWLEKYRASYLSRGERTRRPLSEDWRTQVSPARCTHEYVKGPWVLYMLEQELGSEAFWAATREYLLRHSDGLVHTHDLARTIFDVTGRNVEGFLEQWVQAGGHPEYEVRLGREGDELTVLVKQTQRTSELVPLFDVTVVVEVIDDGGPRQIPLRIADASEEFRISLIGELRDLVFDAPCRVLCTIDLEKDPVMWARQAGEGSAAQRWRALGELDRARRSGSGVAEEALLRVANDDEEVLLRRRAIARLRQRRDVGALLEILEGEEDPMARLEILQLLARQRLGPLVVANLEAAFAGVESERVSNALASLNERLDQSIE